jgi:hypothetical protein
MPRTRAFHRQRRPVRPFTRSEFVQRDEFCELLLSSRRMIRADEPDVNLRGLVDLETGTRFLIKQESFWER